MKAPIRVFLTRLAERAEKAIFLYSRRHSRTSNLLLRYGFALASVMAVAVLRYSLEAELGDRVPFSFFLLSTIAAAWFGGFGPGVVALVLGALVGNLMLMEPVLVIGIPRPADLLQWIAYLIPGFVAIVLIETLHQTTRNLELAMGKLESELTQRRKVEEELRKAQEELQSHATRLEKRVEERTASLEETIQTLETFSYTIAHNLRAPIRAIDGFSDMLTAEFGGGLSPEGATCVFKIRDAAKRMDELICDLIGYNHTVRSRWKLSPVPVEPRIRAAIDSLKEKISEKRAEIRLRGEFPTVMGEVSALDLVFAHLIENAIKFVEPGKVPVVEIFAEDQGKFTRISVRDNGIGIPAEYHERIFGIFEKLSTNYEGNGIGLPMVEGSAKRMGGRAGVSSVVGEGSTFWVELVKAEAGGGTLVPRAGTPQEPAGGTPALNG